MRDIDLVVAGVREQQPDAHCEQLTVKHPDADDDGVWFFERGSSREWSRVQVEAWNGMCPFVVENDASPNGDRCATVRETIDRVLSMLRIRAHG